jgi:D-3-phosphoglycerate dehydrogenase
MQVLACDIAEDRRYAEAHGIRLVSLEQLLREADFVTLHAPLMAETQNLMNAERLALMKPTAFLINTARGGLVDETALHDALLHRRIAGAGLDVFRQEPPTGSPLLALDNVILSPHAFANSMKAEAMMGDHCIRSVLAVARGEDLTAEYVVNYAALHSNSAHGGDVAR